MEGVINEEDGHYTASRTFQAQPPNKHPNVRNASKGTDAHYIQLRMRTRQDVHRRDGKLKVTLQVQASTTGNSAKKKRPSRCTDGRKNRCCENKEGHERGRKTKSKATPIDPRLLNGPLLGTPTLLPSSMTLSFLS